MISVDLCDFSCFDSTDCFHPGQVWESPRGTLYKVIENRVGGQATLRLGADGKGRIHRRGWSDVINWTLHLDGASENDA